MLSRSRALFAVFAMSASSFTSLMAAEPTNRLIGEKSPYLLQHARNPVDWYPWGEEAFKKARAERKPIFLSIGYSTCHWCHVMERESFENEEIAAFMNAHFVNIKVDREERPDVDRVYMTFVQATTGGGGWPMSVWLTPELKPFVGGTYFPPEGRGGQPGFLEVLKQISEVWREDRARIVESSERVMEALRQSAAPSGETAAAELPVSVMPRAYGQIARGYDARLGGFGGAPKFPRPVTLEFLLRMYAGNPESENGRHALEMTLHTLRAMAAGGMHDQLGGGFHRYSVDARWQVPHFEKMLYDQGQLAGAYASAFQITGEAEFAEVARDICDYVLRDLTAEGGAFFTAEDADSLIVAGQPAHAEGAFYVWTQPELVAALGAETAAKFAEAYGVSADGNVPASADPHGEMTGKSVLYLANDAKELDDARKKLFAMREQRPRPHLDDKILTAWNGLMISGLARAGAVLDEPRYLAAAAKAAGFLRGNLTKDGRLPRSFRGEPGRVLGFADDYAFLIQGLIDLYEAGADIAWLQWATELQETQDQLFWDAGHGGYFTTSGDDPSVLLRMKEDYDGAEPSPNSVSALNLARLAGLLDRPAWRERAENTVTAFRSQLTHQPTALPQMLVAVDFLAAKPRQIVLAGEDTKALRRVVWRHYLPDTVLLHADGGPGQKWLAATNEFLETVGPIGGKPAAFVCENYVCQLPVTDPAVLEKNLRVSASPR